MLLKSIARHSALITSLIAAILLSLESFLSLYGKSICSTKACEVVSSYIAIPESFLISGGALGFWFLSLSIFFATRYPDKAKSLPIFLLAAALAIDSSLIGFQIFTIQQYCLICLIVAILLILVTLLYCLQIKQYTILTCLICIWLGAFGVQKIMVMPMPAGAYQSMSFYSTASNKVVEVIPQGKMTLIFSMNCPHCLEVIKYLSVKELYKKYTLNLVSVDRDATSLSYLQEFLAEVPKSSNPFELLKEIKEQKSIQVQTANKNLQIASRNGLVFLSNLGIKSVPVLLVEPDDHKKLIFVGSEQILDFLRTKDE